LFEVAEAAARDVAVVDEHVRAALVLGDEAEALLAVEPLDGTGGHGASPIPEIGSAPRPPRRGCAREPFPKTEKRPPAGNSAGDQAIKRNPDCNPSVTLAQKPSPITCPSAPQATPPPRCRRPLRVGR